MHVYIHKRVFAYERLLSLQWQGQVLSTDSAHAEAKEPGNCRITGRCAAWYRPYLHTCQLGMFISRSGSLGTSEVYSVEDGLGLLKAPLHGKEKAPPKAGPELC